MNLVSTGRVVFVAQWILAVVLPVFLFVGRGLVGAELGWTAVVGVVYGWILIVLLLVPPLVALFDAQARRARTVRTAYAIATETVWLGLAIAALTIPDTGDAGHLRSALSAWTGASYELSVSLFTTAFTIAALAWLAAIVTAIIGIVRSRRAA